VPQSVGDRAFFYLARIGYQRGYYENAWSSLQHTRGTLPGQLEPERRLLASNVLRRSGAMARRPEQLRPDRHVRPGRLRALNIGVALVRTVPSSRGANTERVGTIAATSEEQRSLRDRANLALGSHRCSRRTRCGRDRADAGPLDARFTKARGWAGLPVPSARPCGPVARAAQRMVLDAAVQESYLAVPYAYAEAGGEWQAAEQYQLAVRPCRRERRTDESIVAIRHGGS
jgi:hypothetical protein